MTHAKDTNALGAAGMRALSAGDAATARRNFQAIVDAGAADETVWLALGLASSAQGDHAAAIEAADRVLALQPANIRALALKGDALWEQGDRRGAATFYSLIGNLVPDTVGMDAAAAAEIKRIGTRHEAYKQDLDKYLRAYLKNVSPGRRSARFNQSVDLLSEQSRRYIEEPRAYYFPELPCIQFYERDAFDWAPALEAKFDTIIGEFEAALASAGGFRPYIHATGNKPVNPDHPLLDNMDWSALFLQQNGARVEDVAAKFPETLAALSKTPLETIPGRGPSILVSRLAAGARIGAHTGFLNTRLTCHVPLKLPGRCGLRVGNETRAWEAGRLLIFNDAIEHEAWNESSEDRYVLIFQIWRPELTMEERALVSSLLQGIEAYSA